MIVDFLTSRSVILRYFDGANFDGVYCFDWVYYFDGVNLDGLTWMGQLRRVYFNGTTSTGVLQQDNFDDLLLIGKQVFEFVLAQSNWLKVGHQSTRDEVKL